MHEPLRPTRPHPRIAWTRLSWPWPILAPSLAGFVPLVGSCCPPLVQALAIPAELGPGSAALGPSLHWVWLDSCRWWKFAALTWPGPGRCPRNLCQVPSHALAHALDQATFPRNLDQVLLPLGHPCTGFGWILAVVGGLLPWLGRALAVAHGTWARLRPHARAHAPDQATFPRNLDQVPLLLGHLCHRRLWF
jgi:hypothetical protein